MDLALLFVLRDSLMRRFESAALTRGDVGPRGSGATLINVRRSKTDPGRGRSLYIGKQAE